MASAANARDGGGPAAHISRFIRTASTRVSSFLTLKPPSPPPLSLKIHHSLLPHSPLSVAGPSDSAQSDSLSSNPSSLYSAIGSTLSSKPGPEFPSGARISTAKRGEPAFVGRVYSIYDGSGSGLMDASSHFNIPFLSKRTPEWLKEMFAAVPKSDKNSTGSSFFMDRDDAVSYLQEHYIPNGVVGNCNLAIAYEHFKEKPHLVQFVPNERQVKEANKLLKTVAHGDRKKKLDGVPVFSSQNLDLAIETTDGIRSVLDASVDRYFQSLIARRYIRRWREDDDGDVDDHNLTGEVVEVTGESMWDPPEVQEVWHEVSDEMGHPGIPLNLLAKAAETGILYAVDKILLGNRWLRKATGIQPEFPYVVDSFEKRAANCTGPHRRQEEVKPSPLLPKITIVDISTGEPETSKASSQKTISDLLEELEQESRSGPTWTESMVDESCLASDF